MTIERPAPCCPPAGYADFTFPAVDSPSIAPHRVQNADVPIARFGASSWSLAALDKGDRPTRTIHFAEWPDGFSNFARHVAYVLINQGNPEALVDQPGSAMARWPSGASIDNILHRLRAQAHWLTKEWSRANPDTPVVAPDDMDPKHLDDLKFWIEEKHTNARVRGKALSEVIRVWHLNPWLPEECQWPEPMWRHHDWVPKRRKSENKTLPINESSFAPLLDWAIAFVTSFAPDVIAAQKHYLDQISSCPLSDVMTAADYLDEYASAGVPLPPRPAAAGRKRASGVGWHVLEYRHGLPCKAFSSAFTGARKARLRLSTDSTLTALDTPITGEFKGRAWIPFIGVYDVAFAGAGRNKQHGGPLAVHLRTACMIVIIALTGMRPEEVLNLQQGAALDPITRPLGSRLQLIQGRVFKGVSRLEDGSPRDARPAVWATIPVAAAAVRVAEQVNEILGRSGGLLFSEEGYVSVYTRTATGWISSFIEFVNTRLVPHTERPALFTIPPDPDGAVTLSRFRRTLAWFIRHRPNGDITAAIQFQHLDVTMSEGYGGTKESGIPGLILDEDWNHRKATIRQLDDLLSSGKGIGGPAAERAIEATRKLPRHLQPADERRLRKDKSLTVYDNPAAIALCIYNESTALCQKIKQAAKDTGPDLLGCLDGCPNCVRTDDHLVHLTLQTCALRDQAEIVPLPMAQSLLFQADRNERIIRDFDATRITLDEAR